MGIHRTPNPPGLSIGDAMELEGLAIEIKSRYAIDPEKIWHDSITLGELFDRARSAK
jgi:hypothetical protein